MGWKPLFSAENAAPEFVPIAQQYVMEGEPVNLKVSAIDPDGGAVSLGMTTRPIGAKFSDNKNGSANFEWIPDYSGPNSSEGSPFDVTFWASDGLKTNLKTVRINVINKNRKPYIVFLDTIAATAGMPVNFDLSGYDPDMDGISWTTLSLPGQSSFAPGSPALFNWSTTYADSGYYNVRIALYDAYGAGDTANITLNMFPAVVYALGVDTVSVYSGEIATLGVNLNNLEPISGFDILVNFDVSALTLASISRTGTRSASFEYFSYYLNNNGFPGDIRVVGIADIANSIITADIDAGAGPLFKISLYVTSDLDFAGYSIPVGFAFHDLLNLSDNTLRDTLGARIEQNQIDYTNGYIKIKKVSDNGRGDINLNGVSYEIGDAIYFTNYFIDPNHNRLDVVQRANSDVNQDGLPATVADLVYLMNKMVNSLSTSTGSKPRYDGSKIDFMSGAVDGKFVLASDYAGELGAIAITLETSSSNMTAPVINSVLSESGMVYKWKQEDNLLRLIIFSETGGRIPSGTNELFSIENNTEFNIKEIQAASVDGYPLAYVIKDGFGELLPKGFALYQNHPNPFNPATTISFDLPKATAAELTVYNLLGQEVCRLVSGNLPAGTHTVIWDGRDNSGKAVSSGIYLYNLKAADFSAKMKMIFLK
jgi:hypothetical protein